MASGPTNPIGELIQHLRGTLLPEGADLTDGQLLDLFDRSRDPAALEVLVRRYGPMVWNVCSRVLHDRQDTEDAFQATFLVLVRKAASIRYRARVGNWLYGVAHQTARKARTTRAKRRAREALVTQLPEPAAPQHELWSDVRPLLDQELTRLPEKYRAALVLCELGGQTIHQAAQQLGCPEGTVASRLARARTMLAKRLARHGLAVTGATLAGVLAQGTAAAVPASVLGATLNVVKGAAAGKAAAAMVSVSVTSLVEGVLRSMWLTRFKNVTALVLAIALLGAGGGVAVHRMMAASPDGIEGRQAAGPEGGPTKAAPAPAAAQPQDDPARKIRALQQERIETLKTVVAQMTQRFQNARGTFDEVLRARQQLLKAELETADNDRDRIKLLEKSVELMRQLERIAEQQARAGVAGTSLALQAKAARLETEIELERAKLKVAKQGK